MSDSICVKSKTAGGAARALKAALFAGVTLTLGGVAVDLCGGRAQAAETKPVGKIDPVALLEGVREAQASIKQTLQGKLRKGPKSIFYRMVMDGPRVRFEFPNATPPAPLSTTPPPDAPPPPPPPSPIHFFTSASFTDNRYRPNHAHKGRTSAHPWRSTHGPPHDSAHADTAPDSPT